MSASDIPVISGNPDDDNPPLSPRTNYGDDDNSPLCAECLCDRDNCECFVCPDCDSPWDNDGTCNCDALNGSSQKDKPIAKICMVCPPGTVHNPPLLKLSNLSSHYRNFHRNDEIPIEHLAALNLCRCDLCAGVFSRSGLSTHKCKPELKRGSTPASQNQNQPEAPQLPPNGPILDRPPNDVDWTWGSPNSSSSNAKFSWLFVPLIRCSLGLDDCGGLVAHLAGDRWKQWTDAYSEDFKARGIVAAALPFENGYIHGPVQERLLLGPFAGGQSNVSDAIEGAMTQFAVNTLNVYGVATHPIHHRPRSAARPDPPSDPQPSSAISPPHDTDRLTPKKLATHRRLYSSVPHGVENDWIAYARPAWMELIAAHEQEDSRACGQAIDSILTLPARGLVRSRGGHKRRNLQLRAHLRNLPRREAKSGQSQPRNDILDIPQDLKEWKAKLNRAAQVVKGSSVPHLRRAVQILTRSGIARATPANIEILRSKHAT